MEPIKINVKDNFKHTQIAFLVDREDFRKDIIKVRDYFNKRAMKNEFPFASEKFDEWFSSLKDWGGTKDEFIRGSKLAREKSQKAYDLLKQGKNKEAKFEIRIFNLLLNQWQHFSFELEVEKLLKKYKVPSTCFKAVARVIVCSQVDESDWSFCSINLGSSGIKAEEIIPSKIIDEPNCTIKITPYLTGAELSKTFELNRNKIISLYKASPYGYKVYARDTVSNIGRDRDWYWKKTKEKLSYGQILKLALENGERISRQGVIDAIQRYKKNLE